MAYPAKYRYTKQHEWADVNGDVANDRNHRLRAARVR